MVRRVGAISEPAGFGPGDHLCWLHEGRPAWRRAAVAFLAEGAEQDERLFYVADGSPEELVEELAGLPDRDAMLDDGRLRVRTVDETHRRDGDLRAPAEPLAAMVEQARDAVRSGQRGLRVATEASSLATTVAQARRLALYELHMDAAASASPVTEMCGYDRTVVPEAAQRILRFVHPLRRSAGGLADCGLHTEHDGRWRLVGEVDRAQREPLRVALEALAASAEGAEGTGDVEIDARDLTMIDVAGLRELAAAAARLPAGRQLVLRDPPDVVERALVLGWDDVANLVVRRT